MNSTSASPSENILMPGWLMAALLLKRLAIWLCFFGILYLGREFFFLGFMTFLFSYMALSVVQWTMNRCWPEKELPGTRKLITLAIFLCLPLLLSVIGYLVMPSVVKQAHQLIGWLSTINPEVEVEQLFEKMFSYTEFEQQYGGPEDDRYKKALAEFEKSGDHFVRQYLDFPKLENWVEGSFNKEFSVSQSTRLRSTLMHQGIASEAFAEWFLNVKYPRSNAPSSAVSPKSMQVPDALQSEWHHLAASLSGPDALVRVRHNSKLATWLLKEWVQETIQKALSIAKDSPVYVEQFRQHYERCRQQKPDFVIYTFDEYLKLQQARAKGQHAFSVAVASLRPENIKLSEKQLKTDFEATMKHQLFEKWWNSSSPASFIRHEMESHLSGNATGNMECILASLLNVPLDLCTALLLSFLICIDFPSMQRAAQRLRRTWLRDVYDELVPTLISLAGLIGTSMYAQGLVALCNATLMFMGLSFLGLDHAALLSLAVFLLCLIPTLGMVLSWVLILLMALFQPDGGFTLAIKVTGLVAVVVILETFVFSPRILGKMMELHPVLIISILPIAHAFFGVWGLLLAIPVSVYVINDVIFCTDKHNRVNP